MIRINLTSPKTKPLLEFALECFGHSQRWGRYGDVFARAAESPWVRLSLEERFEAMDRAFLCLERSQLWAGRSEELFERLSGLLRAGSDVSLVA